MKKKFGICFVTLFVVFLSTVPLYAEQELSPNEVRQIEGKIRQDFQQQQAYVDNSLLKIGNDLDQFLFGPETTGNLLKFFNQKIKPGKITDNEALWKEFKNDVINKERFDQFIDELIETHFRVFDKARKEVNRDLVMYGLDGVSEVNYDDIKKQLKEAIDNIWNIEETKMREIVRETSLNSDENNMLKSINRYSEYALVGLGLLPPPYDVITVLAGIVMISGWNLYLNSIGKNLENLAETQQQQFMKEMRKTLETLSQNTREEFNKASDLAVKRLFDAIREMVVNAYPQISRENLQ